MKKDEEAGTAQEAYNFKRESLAKFLVKTAQNNGVQAKKNFVLETLQSSPAETVEGLLQDASAALRLSYLFKNKSSIRDVDDLDAILIFNSDEQLYFCRKHKNKSVQCENLSDGERKTYSVSELKKEFSGAQYVSFTASDEPVKNVSQRLKLLNPLYGFGGGNFLWVATASFFSNLLGLATSLFIMVVYDRVLPNQADETLYALAVGVAIAVLFDQILKMARSNILEFTATRKDQHISNEIFEQFVDTRVRSSRSVGSLSTIIRDFETYKDFVTSATILALIDLPFIFIFVYVISVVGADLYLIPLICIPIVIVAFRSS